MLFSTRIFYHAIAEMCYPTKFLWLEREEQEITVEEQVAQYYDDQWSYYNELYNEVYNDGVYGGYLEFLLQELQDGPYWQDIREQFGTVREPEPEREPEPSVSGTRTRQPEPEPETDTDSDTEWIYLTDVIPTKPKNGA